MRPLLIQQLRENDELRKRSTTGKYITRFDWELGLLSTVFPFDLNKIEIVRKVGTGGMDIFYLLSIDVDMVKKSYRKKIERNY